MPPDQPLDALKLVFDHHFVPEIVIEQQKRDEFNKRLIEWMRDSPYLRDVLALYHASRRHHRHGAIMMHDYDLALPYSSYVGMAGHDDGLVLQTDRRAELSQMTRDDKWKVVPFLRALGFWVTIFYPNVMNGMNGCPFSVHDGPSGITYMAGHRYFRMLTPLESGDFDLTPPTMRTHPLEQG